MATLQESIRTATLNGEAWIVSDGTLNPTDLAPVMADLIEKLSPGDDLLPDARKAAKVLSEQGLTPGEYEWAEETLMDVMAAIDECAPAGTYFGAHPDDGACFGFFNIEAGE